MDVRAALAAGDSELRRPEPDPRALADQEPRPIVRAAERRQSEHLPVEPHRCVQVGDLEDELVQTGDREPAQVCEAGISTGSGCATSSRRTRKIAASSPAVQIPTATQKPHTKPWVNAWSGGVRSARSVFECVMKTVESTAVPIAPPTCCDVLIRPEASPAFSWLTPASAAIVIGMNENGIPMPTAKNPGSKSIWYEPLASICVYQRHPATSRLMLGHWERHGLGLFSVLSKEDGQLVGRVGYLLWDPERWVNGIWESLDGDLELEIGWTIDRRLWGKGFATEAALVCRDHAFAELGRDHVISLIAPENVASIRVAEKIGESYERDVDLPRMRVGLYSVATTLG